MPVAHYPAGSSKGGQFMPKGGGGIAAAPSVKVGQKHTFASGKEHGTGKTVTGFKGTVARQAPDGRLMVNAGTNAKPKWVETHIKHVQAPAKTARISTGESKRTYKERLTSDERSAVDAYMSENYKSINGTLRSGKPASAVTAKRIKNLDSAVAKHTLERDTTLYRGFHHSDPSSLKPGVRFRDNGFTSTSEKTTLPYRMAADRKGGVFARVRAPAGTHAAPLHKVNDRQSISKYGGVPEREVLLPRGSEFEVKAVRPDKNGVLNVELELIA